MTHAKEVDFAFFQVDGDTTFSGILNAINGISLGANNHRSGTALVILYCCGVLFSQKKAKIFTLIQGPLVAVVYWSFIFHIYKRQPTFWYYPNNTL